MLIVKQKLKAVNELKFAQVRFQKGVVLLESLIAILIFSMGIIALMGLQTAMLKSVGGAEYRSEAIYVAQQRLGAMWADPTNLNLYIEAAPGTAISPLLPNGRRIVEITPQADPLASPIVQVTVTWQLPGEAAVHRYTTSARVTS
ncbi:MAG: prepilin-type cleavage/methylation domain-containing protein [Methylotenera sp.]|nr:prepilin-type cleavage/methylation domain-containing protein [Methylotenera sp.]